MSDEIVGSAKPKQLPEMMDTMGIAGGRAKDTEIRLRELLERLTGPCDKPPLEVASDSTGEGYLALTHRTANALANCLQCLAEIEKIV